MITGGVDADCKNRVRERVGPGDNNPWNTTLALSGRQDSGAIWTRPQFLVNFNQNEVVYFRSACEQTRANKLLPIVVAVVGLDYSIPYFN